MKLTVFCSPSRYVQGPSATRHLGKEMAKVGLTGKTFVIAGGSANRILAETWKETFAEACIEYKVFNFGSDCTRSEIERAKTDAKAFGAEVIVGAGGGKVLDTARAVSSEMDLAVVNCPTTASSDAPCSALSVVYDDNGEFDSYLFYKKNPDLVLVDTTAIAKAPKRLLVAGMGDALATWFEARAVKEAKKANQVGGLPTKSGTSLARLCYETLLEDGVSAANSVDKNEVSEALERLVEANTLLSGLGFESGGLAVAHSVHNGLTTVEETHDFYHGEKVAFGVIVQLVLEERPKDELNEVLEFCKQVGLPVTLAALGIKNPDEGVVNKIAERTVAPGETAHNEPFEVTSKMIREAIVSADRVGGSLV